MVTHQNEPASFLREGKKRASGSSSLFFRIHMLNAYMFSDIKLVQDLKLLLFQVKHIDSVTLEDAIELLRYPVTLVYQHQIFLYFFLEFL